MGAVQPFNIDTSRRALFAGAIATPLIMAAPRAEAEGISPELERIAAEVVASDDHLGDWLWAGDAMKQKEIGRVATEEDVATLEAAWCRTSDALTALHSFEPANIKELWRKAQAMQENAEHEGEVAFTVLYRDLARLAGSARR
jgi:hypothetical protein